MSSKRDFVGLFISAFPAALFGWLIWSNVSLLTENARLWYNNQALQDTLDDVSDELQRLDGLSDELQHITERHGER